MVRLLSAILFGTMLLPVLAAAEAPASGKYWVYFGTYTGKDGSKGIYRAGDGRKDRHALRTGTRG